jgi:hypothetical protein
MVLDGLYTDGGGQMGLAGARTTNLWRGAPDGSDEGLRALTSAVWT